MIQSIRVAVWSTIIGVSFGLLVLGMYYSEEESLAQAKRYLLEEKYDGASKIFGSLNRSFFNGDEARLGFALSSLLDEGALGADHSYYSEQVPDGFPYRLLLFQSLINRRFRVCSEMAKLLAKREEWAPLFEAAAQLELEHQMEETGLPDGLLNSWLGQRLQRTQQWLRTEPQMMVYDRRGIALGVMQEDGVFELAESSDAGLLPPAVLAHLNAYGGKSGCRLSVDSELSRMALNALADYRGSIVILSPETGDVLVAVSDRATLEKEGFAAFRQAREPASISKLITTTAAMRAGIDVDNIVSQMSCQGAERYQGGILYCSYRAGTLEGLNHALAISCNIAFANLGIMVGRKGMLEELYRYGFDRPSSDGFSYGSILTRKGNQLQLADLSIGLEATSITPLHAALVAAVYGNQGVMPEPRLLAAEDGWMGLSPTIFPAETGQEVIDASWIPVLLESMEAVTQRGTGHGISAPNFLVAMKTGTGRNKNMGFHTNYIGIGPMPNPTISFCIRITNQATSGRVRRATLKVAKRFFDNLAEKPYLVSSPVERN